MGYFGGRGSREGKWVGGDRKGFWVMVYLLLENAAVLKLLGSMSQEWGTVYLGLSVSVSFLRMRLKCQPGQSFQASTGAQVSSSRLRALVLTGPWILLPSSLMWVSPQGHLVTLEVTCITVSDASALSGEQKKECQEGSYVLYIIWSQKWLYSPSPLPHSFCWKHIYPNAYKDMNQQEAGITQVHGACRPQMVMSISQPWWRLCNCFMVIHWTVCVLHTFL